MTVHERGVMGDGRYRCIEPGQLLRFVDRAPQRTTSVRLCLVGPHQPPLLSRSGHGPVLHRPSSQRRDRASAHYGVPLSQKHDAAKRRMIALAASAFPWPGEEIPSKPLLREHQRAVLLSCANDLRFRAEAAAKTGTNNHSPVVSVGPGTSARTRRGPGRPCLSPSCLDDGAALTPAAWSGPVPSEPNRPCVH